MYVIDVIPLSRTAPGTLSYRSSVELPVGSVVDIVLRKTLTQGIVVASLPVTDAKEMLKHARFLLSKSAPSPSGSLPESFMRAAQKTAAYHATSVGAVLATLFGEYVQAGMPIPLSQNFISGSGFTSIVSEKSVAGRSAQYKELFKSSQKEGRAVLLIVPTIAECLFWKEELSAYKPLVLSGTLSGARRAKALESAVSYTGLVIATPSFSWTPIASLGLIIVDRISAGTYTLPRRPYLNMVCAIEELARAREVPLVYGDFPIPLEYRAQPEAALQEYPGRIIIHDARRDPDDQEAAGTPWQAIPVEVVKEIESELAKGGRVVVLAVRSGYAPAVVCRDCGQAVTDERGMPLAFTAAGGTRVFRSSDGKTVISANMKCTRCDSWNLLPLGVGLERVAEELQKEFPTAPIISIPADSLRTPRAAKAMLEGSLKPGTITIATEAFLPWMLGQSKADSEQEKRLPLGVIASADSLLALPFWRARERFVRLGFLFRTLCNSLTLITRHPEDAAVGSLKKNCHCAKRLAIRHSAHLLPWLLKVARHH